MSRTQTTTHETLVGLHVTDEAGYQRYRAAMTPLLEACGGRFRYDFRVSEMLRGETPEPINRVFVIAFPSVEVMHRFFADPKYLAIRREHFEPAVRSVTRIAAYERGPE
jgi:uncharacterized protein (DUF1330 family)